MFPMSASPDEYSYEYSDDYDKNTTRTALMAMLRSAVIGSAHLKSTQLNSAQLRSAQPRSAQVRSAQVSCS